MGGERAGAQLGEDDLVSDSSVKKQGAPSGHTPRKRLTPKQRVLKKYPEAVCLRAGNGWSVWHRIDAHYPIGSSARSATVAWQLADMKR